MGSARKSKARRPPTVIRGILGKNVIALRDDVYGKLPNITARNRALASEAGTTLSQIQRICDGKLGTSIDVVEWLAEALGVRPHDLLTPYFTARMPAPTSEPDPVPGGARPLWRSPLTPMGRRPR